MPAPSLCPKCGSAKPADAPAGLCPACLFSAILTSPAPPRASLPLPAADASAATTGSEPTTNQDPDIPSTLRYFGDYEILERIAEGGMGIVYKARQTSLNRLVAVKMIRAGHLANERDIRRFHTEAMAAAKLKHPHIVPVHEVGEYEGRHYFSLDLLEGGSLAREVQHHPLTPRRAASVLRTLADAIQFAHDHGVLHRDLKPSNVLLDAQGDPHLTDFGLAKVIESRAELTLTGEIFGTPNYLSPEQARGEHARVGPLSDVYSLGAILYELLTGRPPFAAPSVLETIQLVVGHEPNPPRLQNPGLPRDLETICLKCLAKAPSDRYRSARELEADLDRFLRDEPILAIPSSRAERAWRWCRREPRLALALTASLLFLLVGSVASLVLWRRSESARLQEARARARTEQQLYAADLSAAFLAQNQGSLAPARALLARHQHQPELHDFAWHYLKSRTRGDQIAELPGHSDAISQIAFSPDGKILASRDAGGHLIVWDLQSRTPRYSIKGTTSLAGFLPPPEGGLVIGTSDDEMQLRDALDARVVRRKSEPGLPLGILPNQRVFVLGRLDAQGGIAWGWGNFGWEIPDHLLMAFEQPWNWFDPIFRSPPALKPEKPAPSAIKQVVGDKAWTVVAFLEPEALQPNPSVVKIHTPSQPHATSIVPAKRPTAISLSPSGRHLLIGRDDGAVERHTVPDLIHPHSMRPLPAHRTTISAIRFLSNDSDFVTGGDDLSLKLWSVGADAPWGELLGHSEAIVTVSATADDQTLASGGEHGELLLWHLSASQPRNEFPGAKQLYRQDRILFSPDSRTIALRTAKEGQPILIDVASMLQLRRLEHSSLPNFFSSAGTALVLGATIHRSFALATNLSPLPPAVEFSSPRNLLGSEGERNNLLAKAISPSRRYVAFSIRSRGVVVCDGIDGREIARIATEGPDVPDLAFTADEALLATIDQLGQVYVLDLGSRKIVARFPADPGSTPAIVALANGERVATAGRPSLIRIWDPRSGELLETLRGHSEEVTSLASSPGGTTLASGGADGVVKLWDLRVMQEIATLSVGDGTSITPRQPIRQLAFSPDALTLAALTDEGTLRTWNCRRPPPLPPPLSTAALVRSPQRDSESPTLNLIPRGWTLVGSPDYSARLDRTIRRQGKASASLASQVNTPVEQGILRQTFSAETYRGNRVRLDLLIKSALVTHKDTHNGLGSIRIQVTDPQGAVLSTDDLDERSVTGTNDWSHYRLVFDVIPRAQKIRLDCSLQGLGQIWVDDLELNPTGEARLFIPDDVRFLRGSVLANPGFELVKPNPSQPQSLGGWTRTPFSEAPGSGRGSVRLDASTKHSGTHSAHLQRPPTDARFPVSIYQHLVGEYFAGSSIRLTGFLRAAQGTSASVRLSASGRSAQTSTAWTNLPSVAPSEWQKFQLDLAVPKDATSVGVLSEMLSPGEIWLDDFALAEVAPPRFSIDGPTDALVTTSAPAKGALILPRPTEPLPQDNFSSDLPGGNDTKATPDAEQIAMQELETFARDPTLPRFRDVDSSDSPEDPLAPWTIATLLETPELRPYRAVRDNPIPPFTDASLRLESTAEAGNTFGLVSQTIPAWPFRGKRLELHAQLRTAEVSRFAALWFSSQASPDLTDLRRIEADSKANRIKRTLSRSPQFPGGFPDWRNSPRDVLSGSSDWTSCSSYLDVPPDAEFITCGLLLAGNGRVWMQQFYVDCQLGDRTRQVIHRISDGGGRLLPHSPLRTQLLNAGFDDLDTNPQISSSASDRGFPPHGWSLARNSDLYRAASDNKLTRSGRGSAVLDSNSAGDEGDARLFQELAAEKFRGRRVRWAIYARAASPLAAGIDGQLTEASGVLLANHQSIEPIGGASNEWKRYELVFDVPETAERVSLGFGLAGSGRVWFDDAEIQIVSKEVPLTQSSTHPIPSSRTPKVPINLGFEDDESP